MDNGGPAMHRLENSDAKMTFDLESFLLKAIDVTIVS